MKDEDTRKLTVTTDDGKEVTINVLDIIESPEFNKEFIIYLVDGNEETVFASILNESEETFSLDTIENDQEIEFVNKKIDEYLDSIE